MHNCTKCAVSALLLTVLFSCALPMPAPPEPTRLAAPALQGPSDQNRIYADASFGVGDITVDPDGITESDASAIMFQAFGEFITGANVGAGARIWSAASDDELNTLGPNTESDMFGIYGHFSARPQAGIVEFPIRVGFVLDSMVEQDDSAVGDPEIGYVHFGAQVEFMPEVNIPLGEEMTLGFWAGGHVGTAYTVVTIDVVGLDETDDTDSVLYGYSTGVRFTYGNFGGSVGWVHRAWDTDMTTFEDAPGNRTTPGVVHDFSGVLFSGTFRF